MKKLGVLGIIAGAAFLTARIYPREVASSLWELALYCGVALGGRAAVQTRGEGAGDNQWGTSPNGKRLSDPETRLNFAPIG
jgi:hypothetical protein